MAISYFVSQSFLMITYQTCGVVLIVLIHKKRNKGRCVILSNHIQNMVSDVKRVISDAIMDHSTCNNLLSGSQYGFIPQALISRNIFTPSNKCTK